MTASYDYDSDCSAFCDGNITFSANTVNYGNYTGLTLGTQGNSIALKYTYDNYEEKDSLWKTEQNFTDEEWENFCAEEQLEDEDINYNW